MPALNARSFLAARSRSVVPAAASRPLAGAAAPAAPAGGVVARAGGIDVYSGNNMPSWRRIRDAGVTFVVHKCSEGGRGPDYKFAQRYAETRANGLIRGSYHYYRHKDGAGGAVQGDQVATAVTRLGPGDLAPALDFEHSALQWGSKEPPTADAWRAELEAFLDTIETKLGRTPLIYTRAGPWAAHLVGDRKHPKGYRAADFAHFGIYPLWIIHYSIQRTWFPTQVFTIGNDHFTVHLDPDRAPKRIDAVFPNGAVGDQLFKLAADMHAGMAADAGERLYTSRATAEPPAGEIPDPWRLGRWSLYQYTPYTPRRMLGLGFDRLTDFNVTKGGIHFLRGLADLGHVSPHLAAGRLFLAVSELDGRIHLLEQTGRSWVDRDVARDPSLADKLPPCAGDPAALGVNNEQFIVFRAVDGTVRAVTRNLTAVDVRWRVEVISDAGGPAFGDPGVLSFQNDLHVIYWTERNGQVHLTRVNGVWQTETFPDRPTNATSGSQVSGIATAYEYKGKLHTVCRSRAEGHLFDFVGGLAPFDLTAGSHDRNRQPAPPATYRPAIYVRAGEAPRIVFRALRGHLWQIKRDTLSATDLTEAASAPGAAGRPAVASGQILYRGTDGAVHAIFEESGTWKTLQLCAGSVAASDPAAYVEPDGNPAAAFRTVAGPIRVARFVNGAWSCEDIAAAPATIQSMVQGGRNGARREL